ncbi:MAG TPA: hypothetical protein VM848_17530 [Acidimicrobiia bacterium]|nr:hypothetical protein [Acidimicrobiia bacterium]
MARLDRLVWAAQHTFSLGPFHLGVRSSDSDLASAMARSLSARLVPDVIAPANYSILLPEGKQAGVLYRGYQSMVRTSDTTRLVWATMRHLASHVEEPSELALGLDAVVRGDQAVLAPRGIATMPRLLSKGMQEKGYQFLDAPWIDLSLERGELRVAEPGLGWDPEPMRDWMYGDPQFQSVKPGVYRLAGVVLEAPRSTLPRSSLFWVPQTLRRARNLKSYGPQRAIDGLLNLLDRVPVRAAGGGIRELAAAVTGSLDGLDD